MSKKSKKSNKPVVIPDSRDPKYFGIIKALKVLADEAKDSGTIINLTIGRTSDGCDPATYYPLQSQIPIPERYHMQFESTRRILFSPENKLSNRDLYLFHFLCEKFAEHLKFYVNAEFWAQVQKDMECMGIGFAKGSVANSLSKLVKCSLILKHEKGIYSLNKILIYAGPLSSRISSIQNQFFPTV